MKNTGLKVFLGAIYAALIILLLLMNFCNRPRRVRPPRSVTDTETVYVEPEWPEDTATTEEEEALNVGAGQDADLKVTLLWDFPGDIDLHVTDPGREEIYYGHKRGANGELDHDDQQGGPGSAENIYFANAQPGQYKIQVKYYKANGGPYSGNVKVFVFQHGRKTNEYSVPFRTDEVGVKKDVDIITLRR